MAAPAEILEAETVESDGNEFSQGPFGGHRIQWGFMSTLFGWSPIKVHGHLCVFSPTAESYGISAQIGSGWGSFQEGLQSPGLNRGYLLGGFCFSPPKSTKLV